MRVVRVVPRFVRVAAVVCCLAAPVPTVAQEAPDAAGIPETVFVVSAEALREKALKRSFDDPPQRPLDPPRGADQPRRPAALLPLYGSLIALQAMDIHSTRRAIDAGRARERNPAMREVVGHGAAFVAVKAGATAGVIWASEKLWKKKRKTAVAFASLLNVAMAAIVANNYRVGDER